MKLEELTVLLPCHSLEDFPMYYEGEAAEGVLDAPGAGAVGDGGARVVAPVDDLPDLAAMLGERLTIRHIPQLVIRHDDSIEAGDRVLRLLNELERERDDDA